MRFVLYIHLFLILCMSCKKSYENTQCKNEGKGGEGSAFTTYVEMEINKESPCFNPRNEEEFVYYKKDYINNKFQIIKHNISTQQEYVLAEKKVLSNFSWNKNGTIVFASDNFTLWTIQDNGSNLKQIINTSYNLSPHWFNNGDTLIFHYSPDLSTNRKICMYYNGQYLKYIENTGLKFFTPYQTNEILYTEYTDDKVIKKLNLINNNKTDILKTSVLNIQGLAFSKSSVFYSAHSGSLYIYHIPTMSIQQYKYGCFWKSYTHLEISLSGRYILACRENNKTDDGSTYLFWNDIMLLDLETGEEKQLL